MPKGVSLTVITQKESKQMLQTLKHAKGANDPTSFISKTCKSDVVIALEFVLSVSWFCLFQRLRITLGTFCDISFSSYLHHNTSVNFAKAKKWSVRSGP